jgi:predicted patatin/cPLA2 family phospholipase
MTSATSKSKRFEFQQTDLNDAVAKRLEQKGLARPLQVLVLSGGGANGAWGAGFLRGWTAVGSRPEFDVVTGVSTGGLLATGAFIGDDAMLAQAFTTITDSDVKGSRFFLTIPFSDSVYKSKPLQKLIGRFITNTMIDTVAVEADKHRKLYVASTDMDTGKLHIWDLTVIAQAHDYDFYRTALLASASAPMIFPPVNIEGTLHADGGVTANLFLRNSLLPKIAASHENARRTFRLTTQPHATTQPQDLPKPTIYVIVNGQLGATFTPTQDCLIPLAERAVNCLMASNNVGCLYETEYWAKDLCYDFRLSFIPNTVTACESFTFDTVKMQALYNAGKTYGQQLDNQKVWMKIPDVDEISAQQP